MIKYFCNNCDKLKRELQETFDELKSVRLINELLQTELNATHMAKHVNNVNNVCGEKIMTKEKVELTKTAGYK
jgi:DNA-directed RNA polymerase subunit RPC12/RpoP